MYNDIKPGEYAKLSKEQRTEFYEWQMANKDSVKRQKGNQENIFPGRQLAKKRIRSEVTDLKATLKENECDPSVE